MSPSNTSFSDDFDEFDHLLDDDDAPTATASRRSARPSRARHDDSDHDVDVPPAGRTMRMPRAASGNGHGDARPSVRVAPDWNRIAAVLFVALIALLVAWFAVSSFRTAHRNGGYKDYMSSVKTLAAKSQDQGAQLATILDDPKGGDRAQRIQQIEQVATDAERTLADAQALHAPSQLDSSQQWLETSLQYRADGLRALQRALGSSIDSKDQTKSATDVSQALLRLAASDVVWADSFAVAARSRLKADDVQGVTVPDSKFVTNLDDVSPKNVTQMLTRLKLSGAVTSSGTVKDPKDGKRHGGQLMADQVTVSPAGTTLSTTSLNTIKSGDNIEFDVPFTNQGEVQETQVPVTIKLTGQEADPVTLSGVIDSVDPGQLATAKIPLDTVPTLGQTLQATITVGPIPGEKMLDNNTATYQVQFTM